MCGFLLFSISAFLAPEELHSSELFPNDLAAHSLLSSPTVQDFLGLDARQRRTVSELHQNVASGRIDRDTAIRETHAVLSYEQRRKLLGAQYQLLGGVLLASDHLAREVGMLPKQQEAVANKFKNGDLYLRKKLSQLSFKSGEARNRFIEEQRTRIGEDLLDELNDEQRNRLGEIKDQARDISVSAIKNDLAGSK